MEAFVADGMVEKIRKVIDLTEELYDEHAWAAKQIAALTSGELDKLDRKNLAQYLYEMTVRDQRELANRMRVLLCHMLKIQLQPLKYTGSWERTVRTQRRNIEALLDSVPTLKAAAAEYWAKSFEKAVKDAVEDTGLPLSAFPSSNPWTIEQAMSYVLPPPSSTMDRWKAKKTFKPKTG